MHTGTLLQVHDHDVNLLETTQTSLGCMLLQ
jgi:hypothetical protein